MSTTVWIIIVATAAALGFGVGCAWTSWLYRYMDDPENWVRKK